MGAVAIVFSSTSFTEGLANSLCMPDPAKPKSRFVFRTTLAKSWSGGGFPQEESTKVKLKTSKSGSMFFICTAAIAA
jgi:hypothetical protein